jgi:hypothetical protein
MTKTQMTEMFLVCLAERKEASRFRMLESSFTGRSPRMTALLQVLKIRKLEP